MTRMDGLGFSLCATPLDILGSCILEYTELEPQKEGGKTGGETEVWCILVQNGSGSEGSVSKSVELSRYSN